MFYIFITLLTLFYIVGVLGLKAQNYALRYPESFYSFSALEYGKYFLFLVTSVLLASFFTSEWQWWFEILLIAGVVPVSAIFGHYLAKGEHTHRTDVDLDDSTDEEIFPSASDVYKQAALRGNKKSKKLNTYFEKANDFYENYPVPKLKDQSFATTYKLFHMAQGMGCKKLNEYLADFDSSDKAQDLIDTLQQVLNGDVDVTELDYDLLQAALKDNHNAQEYFTKLLVSSMVLRGLVSGQPDNFELASVLSAQLDTLVSAEVLDSNRSLELVDSVSKDPVGYLKYQRTFNLTA